MADLDFLAAYPDGNAAITVLLPDGTVSRIDNVSPMAIREKCPLLWYAFNDGPNGDQQASIEADSTALVACFLRFLYTGTYLSPEEQDCPYSLLRHAQLYKMAQDFDVPELQVRANVSFLRETEFSSYMPNPPIDLCDAIRFVYKHLADQQHLLDTLLNYCVSSFRYHGLENDPTFRQVAFDTPEFHKGLCRTSFKRDFQDDGASEIVRLHACRPNPSSDGCLRVEKRTAAEFQFAEWYEFETQHDEKAGQKAEQKAEQKVEQKMEQKADEAVVKRRKMVAEDDFTLVHRPKNTAEAHVVFGIEESSDEDSFTVVHRPKPSTGPALPSSTFDVEAAFAAMTAWDSASSTPDSNSPIHFDSDSDAVLVSHPGVSDDESSTEWSLV